jgi:hypothetical protein
MIVPIKDGQPELKVMLEEPGADGRRLVDWKHITLQIESPRLDAECLDSEIIKEGCWPGYGTGWPAPFDWPVLFYPAFELDLDGAVIFRFDDKLWRRPPGRYIGTITWHHRPIAWLDIDLQTAKWVVASVEVNDAPPC